MRMNMNEYQELAQRTANHELGDMPRLAVAALGLAGEAGEIADAVKKHVGHGHELDAEYVKKELGDILWYVAEMAEVFGLSLEQIAYANIAKLKKRYPEGFSEERSINRTE